MMITPLIIEEQLFLMTSVTQVIYIIIFFSKLPRDEGIKGGEHLNENQGEEMMGS